jgi:hypothetical protein
VAIGGGWACIGDGASCSAFRAIENYAENYYFHSAGFGLSFFSTGHVYADRRSTRVGVIVAPAMAWRYPGLNGRPAQVKRHSWLATGQLRNQ